MFDYDLELNLEEELSEIPPEFQDAFRQALAQELADTAQNRTDTDILHYLRRRRDDFKRGSFIRPDGRPGMVTLNPETMYEKALPELAQSSLGEVDNTAARRRTMIKIGVFAAVALVFLFFVFRSRSQRAEVQDALAEGTPAAMMVADGTPLPTPPLPEISGVDDSLQTIGSLGGALTIGRPSAIEISYGRTEETIALAIDPSKPTTKGELRYNETTMLSENPVAVWLFGTVLNYAIGLPDSMVRNLETGDRILLSTDTGASLRFVVAETRQGNNYEAGRVLSQNRVGLTLFSLPAEAESDVSFALASYDITSEEGQGQSTYVLDEEIPLIDDTSLTVAAVNTSHDTNGNIRIVVDGNIRNTDDTQTLMLSLTAHNEQTTAVQLAPDENGNWQQNFTLPDTIGERPLLAELRTLPDGALYLVQLGNVPHLLEQLEIDMAEAYWDEAQTEITFTTVITNRGEGDVYLGSDFIQYPVQGGDEYEPFGQVTPSLPRLIHPGETVGLTVTFLPYAPSVRVQIGADLWQLTTDQQPANGGS